MYARFIVGMPAFLRQRVTLEEARATIAARLDSREASFLNLLEHAVFSRPDSPYLFLLREAGCEPGDLRRMIGMNGVDATLAELFDAGVRVSFDEFKGRSPIIRSGKTFTGAAESFDNPLVERHYESQSSGSTGKATRVSSSLASIALHAPMMILAQEANGTFGAPVILYVPGLPGNTATNNVLRQIITGNPVRRWFSPVASSETKSPIRFRLAGAATAPLVRALGSSYPKMEVVPFDRAVVVARAAESLVRSEGRCLVRCSVSAALTVSLAALDHGVDLTGVTFNGGGEPASAGKVRGIIRSGARHVTSYAMTETGGIGAACVRGTDATDVHFFRDKLGVLQRDQQLGDTDEQVGVFFFTTLLAASPKILINVSSDDFGLLEERTCGCPLDDLGLHQHLRQIRTVGKLTGRGITLVASDIAHIVEEILPSEFGGTAQDYQLVEEENGIGVTNLHLLVSPSIFLSDESAPANALLDALSRGTPGASLQSAVLRSGSAIQVRREQPKLNARGKLPPFRTVAFR